MSDNEKTASQMQFERSDNGVYFAEIRPSTYTPGLLVEVCRDNSDWKGVYLTFHEVHSCACGSISACPHPAKTLDASSDRVPCRLAPKKDMVTAKIMLRAAQFRDLVNGMKHIFETLPETEYTLSLEEKAAILVASEMMWRFPREIITEIKGA